MRLLALILALAPLAAVAQVRVEATGPERIGLGEALVLDVTATRTAPGPYPVLAPSGFTDEEAVVVRAASGEVVELHSLEVVCGVRVSMAGLLPEHPTGTVAHRRLVVHDARLMAPGRYTVEVWADGPSGGSEAIASHAVEVAAPEAVGARAGAEAVAGAVRAATDARYGAWDTDAVEALRGAALAAEGTRAGRQAEALAAIEAGTRRLAWLRSGRPEADSVAAALARTALDLGSAYLAAVPAGVYAPEAARARALALAPSDQAPIPHVAARCDRTFGVAGTASPARLVAVGTGESHPVPAGGGRVVFKTAPTAVHLVVGGETVGAAHANRSTCPSEPLGIRPPLPRTDAE